MYKVSFLHYILIYIKFNSFIICMKLTPILNLRKIHCTKNIIQVYYLKDSKYIFIFVLSNLRSDHLKKNLINRILFMYVNVCENVWKF